MSPSTTRDTAVKWTAYALACLLLLFGHELTLAHLRVWGIAPFLPPLLPAVLASMEDRLEGFVFALAFGVLCDLALTAPLPCLYTIASPLTALLAALIARSVLQPGILCSLAVSTAAFVLVDLITAVTLLAGGRSELSAIALRAVETQDFMTADFSRLAWELLDTVSRRIVNEVKGVNRILYDVTSKPPATVELE